MMMVLAMIAVLMALSLPMLGHANAQARSAVCQQNLAEIGSAINSYLVDHGRMPLLVELPPHQPGLSLPELVGPKLLTTNALFCPSDQTDDSQLLGTSYHWETAYNNMAVPQFDSVAGQPLLADREAFHHGADLERNELVLRKNNEHYQFTVTSSPKDQDADDARNNKPDKPAKPNKNKPGKNKPDKAKPENRPNANANPRALRRD